MTDTITLQDGYFKMIDVGRKRPTRRRAVACGTIYMNATAFTAITNKTLPKGDVLALAEIAGITGAKLTPELIPMCHTLPMDQVTIHCHLNPDENSITVYAQAAAFAKTGVEMEALVGANTALLTIWDVVKGTDANLRIGEVKLLVKTGGKQGVWIHADGIPDWLQQQLPAPLFLQNKTAAVLVMSDRASDGTYTDTSGALLQQQLTTAGADVICYQVIPDDQATISQTVKTLCRSHTLNILIACGGTGPGPRDVTPEALHSISDRMLDGLGDVIRHESLHFTDTAWLSRTTAGMVGATLVVALPGSPQAVQQCWDIISPFIGDTLNKIKKQGFGD